MQAYSERIAADARGADSLAAELDAADPLRAFRAEFHIPPHGDRQQRYFCGNSLGLQPTAVRGALLDELDDWARLGVEAHFHGKHPWMPYHGFVRESLAQVVGAEPSEVVAMNSLTVNLHLMMVSFYRPTPARHAILIEAGAFPSDRYAVESQIRFHGFDPAQSLIELEGDEPDGTISMAALERVLAERGREIALVLWPGVQYRTGQAFDLREVTRLAQAQGATVGFDLAHAAGNLRTAAARQRRRLRRLVQLQVPELRPGRDRRLLRARAPRTTATARASPAGGATTRPAASAWARSSCPRPAPTAGS